MIYHNRVLADAFPWQPELDRFLSLEQITPCTFSHTKYGHSHQIQSSMTENTT